MNDEKIIICPNDIKLKLLMSNNKITNIKYMTKEEFINNYYYKYDENTFYYLMNKYKYNLDVIKVYLKSLYVIDINKNYNSNKLNFLKEMKKELINNKLLTINSNFKNYIKNKKIEIIGYYDLEKYEEEAFNNKLIIPKSNIENIVYKFQTIEEEVNFVCLKIIELLNKGVDINKIFLCNVTSEYEYIIEKIFRYYNIPINLNMNESIYGTKVVNDFLENDYYIDVEDDKKLEINKKLINIMNSLASINEHDEIYRELIIDKIKKEKLNNKIIKNAVNIKNIKTYEFEKDDYVFLLGFNLDSIPKMEKNIDFIDDSIKNEVSLYATDYKNNREKELIIYLISRIKNLFITYKNQTPFQSYYKSMLIKELNLKEETFTDDKYNYSDIYNKIRLSEKLDNYYTYKEENEYLKELNTHYKIAYKNYNNKFTGIDNKEFLEYINNNLKLSYTSINTYNECKFKYYIKNILKLDTFKESFQTIIGSMYHKILSLYKNNGFDFEKEFENYIHNREFSIKEKVLLEKIKEDLKTLIDVLDKQQLLTGYDNNLLEQEINIELDSNKIKTKFIGYIDKIMYFKKNEETLFSIIDYKTGTIDTHIEPMKYGLHMQLPTYLYLIKESNILNNPTFTGIYYQNILFNYPTWSEDIEKEIKNRYLLTGYSTDDINRLSIFDSTYNDSSLIKSMKYSDEKKFPKYTKIITDEMLEELVEYTKNIINDNSKNIIKADFEIDPKNYDGKNISCEFCTFKDICFNTPKDIKYLDKVEDLSFLGGEE